MLVAGPQCFAFYPSCGSRGQIEPPMLRKTGFMKGIKIGFQCTRFSPLKKRTLVEAESEWMAGIFMVLDGSPSKGG